MRIIVNQSFKFKTLSCLFFIQNFATKSEINTIIFRTKIVKQVFYIVNFRNIPLKREWNVVVRQEDGNANAVCQHFVRQGTMDKGGPADK